VRHRTSAALLLAVGVACVLGHENPVWAQNSATPAYEETPLPGRPNQKRSYYPPAAIRQGITGRVCLAYSVDNHGHAANFEVLESGGTLLDGAARQLLGAVRFNVPADWVATGGSAKRYRLGVIFDLTSKPKVPRFTNSIPTVVITAPW
jgi:TonB family protein